MSRSAFRLGVLGILFSVLGPVVACTSGGTSESQPGSLEITSTTTGASIDADGYVISVDGGSDIALATNESITVPDLAAASHEVKLAAVSANCFLNGAATRQVAVPSAGTGHISFNLTCIGPLNSRVVFSGSFPGNQWEIYTMDGNGANITALTDDPTEALYPAVSKDGSRVAFCTRRDGGGSQIYLMDADGSNQQRLTNSVGDDIHPSWSPDGTRLVFARLDVGLFVIDADGSGETPLTNDGSEPAWSPDGTRIAFVSGRDGFARIYTMAPDGSQVVPLTQDPNGAYAPAWSPNSLQIVFAGGVIGFGGHLFTMDADGTRVTPLTSDPIRGDNTPDWSPDGTRIAFGSVGNGTSHIDTINPDGSNFVDLTDDQTAAHERPSWIR